MKKPILILALLLLAAPAWGRMPAYVLGAGGGAGCAACTSSTDVQLAASATEYDSDSSDAAPFAWQFTIGATKCITGIMNNTNDSNNGRGDTCEIWTDSGGVPGAIYAVGYTSTIADLPNSQTNSEFLFSSTQTLPAGTYWVVCTPTDSVIRGFAASVTGTQAVYWGGAWHIDATKKWIVGVLGCD